MGKKNKKTLEKIYHYNGIVGVLVGIDNEKLAGVEPLADNGVKGFYPLDVALEHGIDDDDTDVSDMDCEIGGYLEDFELILGYTLTEEGNIYLSGYMWVDQEWSDDALYKAMLCMDTDSYDNYESELTAFISNTYYRDNVNYNVTYAEHAMLELYDEEFHSMIYNDLWSRVPSGNTEGCSPLESAIIIKYHGKIVELEKEAKEEWLRIVALYKNHNEDSWDVYHSWDWIWESLTGF